MPASFFAGTLVKNAPCVLAWPGLAPAVPLFPEAKRILHRPTGHSCEISGLVVQATWSDGLVACKTARRRGARRELVSNIPVTDEQQRRRAVLHATLRAAVLWAAGCIARLTRIRSDMDLRSRLAIGPNSCRPTHHTMWLGPLVPDVPGGAHHGIWLLLLDGWAAPLRLMIW
jgi:hypothetical protein